MQKKAQPKYSSLKSNNTIPLLDKSLSSSSNLSQNHKFNKSDIVWAKITGYPWWPAIVTTVPGQKDSDKKYDDIKNKLPWSNLRQNSKAEYRVDFIADQTHAFLKKKSLLTYLPNRDRLYVEGLQFSTRKRRYFQMAINQADQLQSVLQISKAQINQCQNKNEPEVEQKVQSENIQKISLRSGSQNFDDGSQQIFQSGNISQKHEDKSSPRCQQVTNQPDERSRSSLIFANQCKTRSQLRNIKQENIHKQKQENSLFITFDDQLKRRRLTRKMNINNQRNQKSTDVVKIFVQENQEINLQLIQQSKELQNLNTFSQEKQRIQQGIEIQQSVGKLNVTFKVEQERSESQCIEDRMNDILKKYNLHNLDQIEQNFKNRIMMIDKDQTSLIMQKFNPIPPKSNKSSIPLKNIFSLHKKKSKKTHFQKTHHTESQIFAQNLSIFSKIKQSDEDKITIQQKRFLIENSKRRTAKKIYSTVLNILKKNKIESFEEQIQTNIRKRSKNIADLIFDQVEIQSNKSERKITVSNKKKTINGEKNNFILNFKKKLNEDVNFLRFLSMQNWNLLTQVDSFSSEVCIEIKSFEEYLEKFCNLKIRNQQKFEDIVKQIGIQNEKTSFTCGHNTVQMEIQHDYAQVSSDKFVLLDKNKYCALEKKSDSLFIEMK